MSSDPLILGEASEWAGLWWLPDDPDEKVPGVLRYDVEGGLSLSLIGAFEDRIKSTPAPGVTACQEGTRTWDVIHGAAEQREITLLGAVPISSKRTIGARVASPDKQTVTAAVAIIGAHVSGEDDQMFAMSEVSVEELGLWAASSVFEGSLGASDGKIDGTGSISVKPVDAQSVVVAGTEYRLVHTHTLPFFDQRKGGSVGRMRDTVSIRVVPAEPFSLSAALQEVSLVQDLISLATHRAAGVIWLRLEVAGTESHLEVPQIGHGRRVGRFSQRCRVQASRRSLRVTMMALASPMKASITRVRFSVQTANFLNPRLCQELVRSTTQRLVFWIGAGMPLAAISPSQPSSSSSWRVALES